MRFQKVKLNMTKVFLISKMPWKISRNWIRDIFEQTNTSSICWESCCIQNLQQNYFMAQTSSRIFPILWTSLHFNVCLPRHFKSVPLEKSFTRAGTLWKNGERKLNIVYPFVKKIAARHFFIEKGHFFCLAKPAVAQGLEQRNKKYLLD